jgi:hypothetical protein
MRMRSVARTLICACALGLSVGASSPLRAQEPASLGLLLDPDAPSTDDWPDISSPGPDMGDFPNSSFTLPKGRVYFECAPNTLITQGDNNPTAHASPFLLRYGITDDLEFRIFGNGLVYAGGDESAIGFAPLAFDLKVHLWDSPDEYWLPASSLEVYIQSEWGSTAFRQGTQKSIALNFDLPVSEQTNLEWTFGYSGVQALVSGVHGSELHANEFSFQWAIEHNLTDDFQVFLTGYYNGAVFLQQGPGKVVGVGASWNLSDRINLFGSLNAGLDKYVAPFSSQLGFAIAI